MSFLSARPLHASVGAESSAIPYNVQELQLGQAIIAMYTDKTTGFPVWGYARQMKDGVTPFEIWLYLARRGIPIYSVLSNRWTSASGYTSQTADPGDTALMETIDVSRGGVIQSKTSTSTESLFVDDPFAISEVMLTFLPDETSVAVNLRAAKGASRVSFSPYDLDQSLHGSGLGFVPQETKPPVGAPPIPEPPTKLPVKSPASKPFPTGKWIVGGAAMGGLLYLLRRS